MRSDATEGIADRTDHNYYFCLYPLAEILEIERADVNYQLLVNYPDFSKFAEKPTSSHQETIDINPEKH